MLGGTETKPLKVTSPNSQPRVVVTTMAISTAECTPRAEKMQIRKKPSSPSRQGREVRLPTVTMVAGLATTMPALCRPSRAMSRPMPAVMPTRRVRGMLAISQ
ncbi:hypothetical protein D3C79_608510 [compost metagenome]